MLGLPATITACLFDRDGVLTQTASVHARAWKEMFDDFLAPLGEPAFELPLECMRRDGVQPYEGSVRYVEAARDAGLRRAVVSSSANAADVLRAARIDDLFETVIDGADGAQEDLADKPAPDMSLAGARALDTPAAQTAVFEDALAGVEAGHNGGFGDLVGVERSGPAPALRARGAQIAACDLADLLEAA